MVCKMTINQLIKELRKTSWGRSVNETDALMREAAGCIETLLEAAVIIMEEKENVPGK